MSDDIMSQRSCIPTFFKGKTIFITGVTGFMGKVLLEKLIRSCPGIRRVYALVRPKKGQTPEERIHAILKSQLYSNVREMMPDMEERIVPVVGDVLEPGLGMSKEDEARVAAETHIVFHSAATVKFDEELKLAVRMNVMGVKRMVEFSKKMPNLEALVHVSTAYANCDKEQVEEVVYDPPLHPTTLIDAMEWMDKDAVEALTSKLIGSRPNTYTYTKAMAEYLFVEETKGMPVAIVRPSIVGATWEEPFPGWIENLNGLTGVFAAVSKGVLHIMLGDGDCTADVIPVDIATNAMIAVAWYTAIKKPGEALVYNCTSGQINKLTWGTILSELKQNVFNNPCMKMLRVPHPRLTLSMFWRKTMWIFDHLVPAHLMDLGRRITGKRPMFVSMQDKLSKALGALEFFTSNEWRFQNKNIFMLLGKMAEGDKETFCFDPRSIDWKEYILRYHLGVQQYVLKEDISQLPHARLALRRLQRIQTFIKVIGAVLIWRLLVKRVPVFHSLWNLLLKWVQLLYVRLPSLARSS